MKIKCFFIFLIVMIICSGCSFSPYVNSRYGEMAVSSWFNDKTLGHYRKQTEQIDEIVSNTCEYVESHNNKYVFKCKITYKEKGETVIPLSKNSTKEVYAVFIKKIGKAYYSKVYNSMYTNKDYKVWMKDKDLNY